MQYIDVDYLVIGAGVAGLSCALSASDTGDVVILAKDTLPSGNTPLAQGGIAVALGEQDTPEMHMRDTLRAGAGACDPAAVDILVREGIERVRKVLSMGFPYDRSADGELLLSKEGAHSVARVVSAGGDGSGRALAETLLGQVKTKGNIRIYQQTQVVDLLVYRGRCTGALAIDTGSGRPVIFTARGVVLATGGCGQIFSHTTNNIYCTGDGFALAYRAGAAVENMEFMQFHPTALNVNENPMVLISEAVRGEGAVLVTDLGERFMPRYHPWAELAPRDVVARGIFAELMQGRRVFLDVSALGEHFAERFPTIYNECADRGLNPPQDLIPVVPAAHFIMGGVKTDLDGRTAVDGLYACGEVASTGVHGANRLASNSLLEGLVFGYRVGRALAGEEISAGDRHLAFDRAGDLLLSHRQDAVFTAGDCGSASDAHLLKELQELMWTNVGLVRSGRGLAAAVKRLGELEKRLQSNDLLLENMIAVARMMAGGALARRESLGSHYRNDSTASWPEAQNLQHVCSL